MVKTPTKKRGFPFKQSVGLRRPPSAAFRGGGELMGALRRPPPTSCNSTACSSGAITASGRLGVWPPFFCLARFLRVFGGGRPGAVLSFVVGGGAFVFSVLQLKLLPASDKSIRGARVCFSAGIACFLCSLFFLLRGEGGIKGKGLQYCKPESAERALHDS